ncbi:MAG: carbohydrate kinase [Bacteroidales bacterium]|nr:carbohydrate kinase [Candidatus Cacconaster merdequi]
MRKIVGIGETVLDIIFRNDKPQLATPGGSTFNSMISLGRSVGKKWPDTKILMVTETGDDHVGDIITDFMESNGVCTTAVTRNNGTQSHLSLAFLDANNDAQYQFYKDHSNASLQESKVSVCKFNSDDIVLFGSYFAINPKIRNYTSSLLRSAHNAGAILYYDVNFRRNHLSDLPDTIGNIEENCRLSDFVRGSAEDFGYLFGTSDPGTIYREHISKWCRNFICTCGPKPVHIFTPSMHLTFEAPQVETVSTIGAGDNFNAGFIFSLIEKDIRKEAVPALSPALWDDLVAKAGLFSANVCRSPYNYIDEDFWKSM